MADTPITYAMSNCPCAKPCPCSNTLVSGAGFRLGFQARVSGAVCRRGLQARVAGAGFRRGFQARVSGAGIRRGLQALVSGAGVRRGCQARVSGAGVRRGFQARVSGAGFSATVNPGQGQAIARARQPPQPCCGGGGSAGRRCADAVARDAAADSFRQNGRRAMEGHAIWRLFGAGPRIADSDTR